VLVSSLLDCIPLQMPDAGQPPPSAGGEQSCSFADVLWSETEQASSEGDTEADPQQQPSTDTILPFVFVHAYVPVEVVPVAPLSLDIPELEAVEAAPEKIVLASAAPVVVATEFVEPHALPAFAPAPEPEAPPTVALQVDIPEMPEHRAAQRVDEEADIPEQPSSVPAPGPSDVAAAPPAAPALRAEIPVDFQRVTQTHAVHEIEPVPERPEPVEHHAPGRATEPVATAPDTPHEPRVTAFTGRLEVTDGEPVLEPAPASHETTAVREQPIHADPRPAPVQPRVEQPVVSHRPAEVAAPAPVRSPEPPMAPAPSAPIQRLHVRVETPSNETISLRFTQRHEAIDVGVRTSSDQVAQTLRAELPHLADGLRREGIQSQFRAPQPVHAADVIEVAPPDVVMAPAAGSTHVTRETRMDSSFSGEREHTYGEKQDQPQQHSRRHKNTQEDEEVDE
jgi:hypothetical protein